MTLRWHIQRGDIVFPKSVTPPCMKENVEIFDFELGSAEINEIGPVDLGEEGRTGPHPDMFACVRPSSPSPYAPNDLEEAFSEVRRKRSQTILTEDIHLTLRYCRVLG